MAKFRFRVLAGQHAEDQGSVEAKDEFGNNVKTPLPAKVYKRGEVVETDRDLAKIFNQPGCEKFEKLDPSYSPPVDTKASAPTDDTLNSMTVAELKAMAAEEEIDLGQATTKADIIAAIRKAYA